MMRRQAFPFGSLRCSGVAVFVAAICISTYALQNVPAAYADFLSIDCGSISTPYTDAITTFTWVDDDNYTLTGVNGNVPFAVNSSLDNYEALQTFRYFPESRKKFCYDLTITGGMSYLVRAMFLHGSSAELVLPIEFDVYINATKWFSVQLGSDDSSSILNEPLTYEGIFNSDGSIIHFCLLPVQDVPFISSLELRQLDSDGIMYAYSGSTYYFNDCESHKLIKN